MPSAHQIFEMDDLNWSDDIGLALDELVNSSIIKPDPGISCAVNAVILGLCFIRGGCCHRSPSPDPSSTSWRGRPHLGCRRHAGGLGPAQPAAARLVVQLDGASLHEARTGLEFQRMCARRELDGVFGPASIERAAKGRAEHVIHLALGPLLALMQVEDAAERLGAEDEPQAQCAAGPFA